MNLFTHEKSREVALQSVVHEIVKDYPFQFDSSLGNGESPLERVLECREHFNNLLQPWFMSKAVIEFRALTTDPEGHVEASSEGEMQAASRDVPWIRIFSRIGIFEIQRAALFEVVLRDLRDRGQDAEANDLVREQYTAYAKSGDLEDLPVSPVVVKYPSPLKSIYESLLKLAQFPPSSTKHVIKCLRFLSRASDLDRFSPDDPPAMDAEEFKKFHLETLQGRVLALGIVNPVIYLQITCSYHNNKIRKLTDDYLDQMMHRGVVPEPPESKEVVQLLLRAQRAE